MESVLILVRNLNDLRSHLPSDFPLHDTPLQTRVFDSFERLSNESNGLVLTIIVHDGTVSDELLYKVLSRSNPPRITFIIEDLIGTDKERLKALDRLYFRQRRKSP